jgi:uncharacterized protein YjdB
MYHRWYKQWRGLIGVNGMILKKVCSFLLAIVVTVGVCFASISQEVIAANLTSFTLNANKTTLKRGDQFTITASMSDNVEAFGVSYELRYDPDKVAVVGEPVQGDIFSDLNAGNMEFGTIGHNTNTSCITAVAACAYRALTNGSIMSVTFQVLDDASIGQLNLQSTILLSDTNASPLEFNFTDNTELSIVVPVTGVKLNKTSTTIGRGETEQLTATVEPDGTGSTVEWRSSDSSVATVDQSGKVTAVSAGNATITATAGEMSASCQVTVDVPLKNITITGNQTSIKKGTTTQLKVSFDPEDTTDSKVVVWSSDDSEIATVDQTGIVTAIADGTTTIRAKAGNIEGTYSITVEEIPLQSIDIKDEVTIHRGETETLQVTYTPENTTDNKTVNWSTSDPKVATVDGSGKIQAVEKGQAIITARVGEQEAHCTVTVDVPLESIVPTSTTIELVKNQKATISYMLNPEDTTSDKSVTFSSLNTDVATVDALTGEVTGIKAGDAVIQLTGADGISAEVCVSVTEIPIDEVFLDKQNVIVEKGQNAELTATVDPEDNTDDDQTITWKSSDESIATVSSTTTNSGEAVTINATNKGGTVTITATAWNGTKTSCTVVVPIHMESISLPADVVIERGETTTLSVTYNPEKTDDTVKTISWISKNPEIAKVDSVSGMITPVKEGKVEIEATVTVGTITGTERQYTASTTVTIQEKHLEQDIGNTIAFTPLEESVFVGQTIDLNDQLNLQQILQDNGITDDISIVWESENTEVASIDQSGCLLALHEGSTTISATVQATDGSGQTIGTYVVEMDVEIKGIPLESIAFNKIIREMTVGEKETLHIIYNPDNTTDLKQVEWISSDASILSVENGELTALKPGIATITAKVGDQTVSCEIVVKENQSENDNEKPNNQKPDDENVLDKNNPSGSPQTGDKSMVEVWAVLLVLSAGMIVVIVMNRQKRKYR